MGTQLLPQKRGHSSPLQLFGQVYCGQTSGKIKMSPGTQGGLGPGSIVLDRDLAPPPKKAQLPNFRPMSAVTKGLDGSRCHLVQR